MSDSESFEVGPAFVHGSGDGVRVQWFEAEYEKLFAEVISDGVITPEEREELDARAKQLGLDADVIGRLEKALVASFEARTRVVVQRVDEPMPASLAPLAPASDPRTQALERRVKFLEGRVAELERELEEARAQVAIEVDFSDLTAAQSEETADELVRRLRHDPRDEATLHSLFKLHLQAGDADRAFLVADVLRYLGKETQEERAHHVANAGDGLLRPKAALAPDSFQKLVLHPEEEPLVGEIFGVIVSAVLLGRVAALRHAKALVEPDPARRVDPATSTVQAIRAVSWAAAILGMGAPPLYADPTFKGTAEMVPGVPPSARLGSLALSGRSPRELAFLSARHLVWYRPDRFVRLLVPSILDLEDVFLAALVIGSPGLPLGADVKTRVAPIAAAIEPLLDKAKIDHLRGSFLRFVEEGGRANLQRWATSADKTANRVGVLLANDLGAAARILEVERQAKGGAEDEVARGVDDLILFLASDRASRARRQLGVAVG